MEDFNEDEESWSDPVADILRKSSTEHDMRDIPKERQLIHKRTIVHIDVDCFYAQVEMIRNPTLRDKPLGIQQKNIVVTCNYVARKYGVTKLMYIKDAKEKCPQLVLVSGEDLTNYRNMSYKISEFLHKYTPYVERLGMDENYLDVSELVEWRKDKVPQMVAGHVYGDSNQDNQDICTCGCYERILIGSHIAEEIRAALYKEMGITCCAGIAHNKLLSKLVGEQHKPNQQTTLFPHRVLTFMSKLPKARSIPGVGSATAKRLAEFGVVTMTDLQQCPLEDLKRELGDSVAATIKELSEGIDMNPVVPYSKPQTLSDEDSFKSCCSVKEANQKIKELIKSLMIRLVEDGRIAGTVRLTIRRLSAENKYLNRESKQCNIPSHVISKLSSDNKEQACDKIEDIVMSLFNKLVDVKKPFHLTLMNVAFCNLTERNKNSISHFFSPQKNKCANSDNNIHSNAGHSHTNQKSELHCGSNNIKSSNIKETEKNCSTSMTLPLSSTNHDGNNSEEEKVQTFCESQPNSKWDTAVPVKQLCSNDNVRHLVNKRKSSSPKSGFFSKRLKTIGESSHCKNSGDLTQVSQDSIDAEVFGQLPPEIQKEITESEDKQLPPSPVYVKQTLGPQSHKGGVNESNEGGVQNDEQIVKDSSNAELTADLTCKSNSKNIQSINSVTKTDKPSLVPAGYDRDVFLNLPPDIQRELIQEEERKAEWAHVKHGRQGVRHQHPQNRDSKSTNAGNLLKYFKRSK